jgi:colicin import membrane protein
MKKLFLSFLMLMTLTVQGKSAVDDSKYLAGAVPEENGMVTFKKSFTVPGKTNAELRESMRQFVNQLVENSIPAPGNYARVMEDDEKGITARVCEWMVFKKKPLNLDRTRFRYQIAATVEGQRITLKLTGITYYYNEDPETLNGIIFKAEEWISDKEALNKKQTKLYPKSGKFRRKTVDRAQEIFNTAMDMFETQPAVPVQPVRKSVIEE